MKNYILFAFLLWASQVHAQNVCIANLRENIIYIGLPNPLHVVAKNVRCKSLVVTTTNGKIKGGHEPCNFEIIPDTAGRTEVIVTTKTLTGLKKIGTHVFHAKKIPDPIAKVAGRSEGKIPKNHLVVQRGIVADIPEPQICAVARIKSFRTVILRDSTMIYRKEVAEGPFFPEEMAEFFKTLKTSDVVLFYDIQCAVPDGRLRHLRPLELTIE